MPVPPIGTQQQIVSVLEKAHELKRKRDRANELANQVTQSLFLRKFGNLEVNQNNWPRLPLEKIAQISSGIALSKRKIPDKFPRPYLTIRNVYAGRLKLSDVRYIEVPDSELERWLLKPRNFWSWKVVIETMWAGPRFFRENWRIVFIRITYFVFASSAMLLFQSI